MKRRDFSLLLTLWIASLMAAVIVATHFSSARSKGVFGDARKTLEMPQWPKRNLGPRTFYPEARDERLYKLPWQEGRALTVIDGYFSDPMGHPVWSRHNGYALTFAFPRAEPVLAARGGRISKVMVADTVCRGGESLRNILVVSRTEALANGGEAQSHDTYSGLHWEGLRRAGESIEQGEIVGYSGCRTQNGFAELEFEVVVEGRSGRSFTHLGGDGAAISNVPTPFVEIDREGGAPLLGERWISANAPKAPFED